MLSLAVLAWDGTATRGPELPNADIAVHLPKGARLAESARQRILDVFEAQPSTVAVYGDALFGGQRKARPAWSPTRSQSEPGSVLPIAWRVGALELTPQDGPWRIEQRLADSTARVVHVPSVLTVHDAPLPVPEPATLADDRFTEGPRRGTRTRRPCLKSQAQVSVVVPSAAMSSVGAPRPALHGCIESLARLDPPPAEVIVVVGDEFRGPANMSEAAAELGADRRFQVRVLHRGGGPFSFSRAVNCGLLASRSEFVLVLNDDVEGDSTDWLGQMAAHLIDPSVGAVGAALLYPEGAVQHVGTLLDDARPLNAFVGRRLSETASHGGDTARDVMAVVAACLLARRCDLLAVGGLSEELPVSFSDTDLCLRLRRHGLRVVVEPNAVLVHREGTSRPRETERWEWDAYVGRWGEIDDPWYHPAFHRPDDPANLNLNADHLGPIDAHGSWAPRGTDIRSRMNHARVRNPDEARARRGLIDVYRRVGLRPGSGP